MLHKRYTIDEKAHEFGADTREENGRQLAASVPGADRHPIQKNSIAENDLNNTSALDEIGTRVRELMGAVFGVAVSTLGSDASSATIAEWDSVRHLQLMLALEEEFNLQFEVDELVSLRSIELIEARLRATTR